MKNVLQCVVAALHTILNVKLRLFFCIFIFLRLFCNMFYFILALCNKKGHSKEWPLVYSLYALLLFVFVLFIACVQTINNLFGDVHGVVDVEDIVTDAA